MTSILRSGTYGLGSLRPRSGGSGTPVIGRLQYSKEERRARCAALREALKQRGRVWWKTPRSVIQLIQLYPDSYQSEIKEVLKLMVEEDKMLVRFMHGNRSFYKATP